MIHLILPIDKYNYINQERGFLNLDMLHIIGAMSTKAKDYLFLPG